MAFPYYTGTNHQLNRPIDLPLTRRAEQNSPENYKPAQGLIDAVNVALLLGQPLLLTGEPGTGKTQLASSVSWSLGLGDPLIFETKSTSTARDLFYTYDTLGRFHAAQTGEGAQDSLDYITYNALGIAILRANEEAAVSRWLPADFEHGGKRRSVVLVDEIDKAPRDFPNDILNEVEGMYFKVPELGNVKIAAEETMRPILILTSNSEKHLPDAFLRRCVYYHIIFPDRERLIEIVNARVGRFKSNSPMLKDALDLFSRLRGPSSGLLKEPATAELIGWLTFLTERGVDVERPLRDYREIVLSSLGILVKNSEDQNTAKAVVEGWL